jgi:hypothetical protein
MQRKPNSVADVVLDVLTPTSACSMLISSLALSVQQQVQW